MKIKWCVWTSINGQSQTWRDLAFFEPVKIEAFKKKAESYQRCPMFHSAVDSYYVIKAPEDFTLEWDCENGPTKCNKPMLCQPNGKGRGVSNWVQTFNIPYLFHAEGDCMAEVFPPLFENRVFPWHLIPGKYNIGKWLRPIDFTIEYKVPKGKIKIKRGEPLFYIHFSTATHETFELERVHQTEGMQHQVGACVSLKDHVMKLKPEETYKMFEECPVKHYHKWFEGKDESVQKHQQPTKEGYQPLEEKEHDKS